VGSFDVLLDDDRSQLDAFIEDYRSALEKTLVGLTEDEARSRLVPSATTQRLESDVGRASTSSRSPPLDLGPLTADGALDGCFRVASPKITALRRHDLSVFAAGCTGYSADFDPAILKSIGATT
jgi:hypothetical protein